MPEPPLTRNSTPDEPDRAPVPKFEVPETVVNETPFVPPEELIDAKFAFRTTLAAVIAGAACGVLLIVPVPFVTVKVPPPVALRPVPAFVAMLSELNVVLAPATPE